MAGNDSPEQTHRKWNYTWHSSVPISNDHTMLTSQQAIVSIECEKYLVRVSGSVTLYYPTKKVKFA